MPSKVLVAKVLVADMRHGTCVKAVDVSCAKPSNAASAKAADVASAKAAHVTSTKAAHVASTAHATAHAAAVAAATTTAAASGLCARGKQASGQHYACQGHYHSPFHDILHSIGGFFRLGFASELGVLNAKLAIEWR
jgi:hypothetical protein